MPVSPSASDIEELAMALEPAKRLSLATRLMDSVEETESTEWTAAWSKELDRRAEALDSGTELPVDWATARAQVLAGLTKR